MEMFFVLVSFAAGGAFIWVTKDWLTMAYDGTTNFARRLEAKAAKIRETL